MYYVFLLQIIATLRGSYVITVSLTQFENVCFATSTNQVLLTYNLKTANMRAVILASDFNCMRVLNVESFLFRSEINIIVQR